MNLIWNILAVIVFFIFSLVAGAIISGILKRMKIRLISSFIAMLAVVWIVPLKIFETWLTFAYLFLLCLSIWYLWRSLQLHFILKGISYVDEHKDFAWWMYFAVYLLFICLARSFPFAYIEDKTKIALNETVITVVCAIILIFYGLYFLHIPWRYYKMVKNQIKIQGFTTMENLETFAENNTDTEKKAVSQFLNSVVSGLVNRKKLLQIPNNIYVDIKIVNHINKHLSKAGNSQQPLSFHINELLPKSRVSKELLTTILSHLMSERLKMEQEVAVANFATVSTNELEQNETVDEITDEMTTVQEEKNDQLFLRLLRFSFKDHPMIEKPYELRKSYVLLLTFALEDLKAKYVFVSELLHIYAMMLGINENDLDIIRPGDSRKNKNFESAIQIMRRKHYEKKAWYYYSGHRYNQMLFAEVAYIRQLLEEEETSRKMLELFDKTLRIRPKILEELRMYSRAVMNGERKLAEVMLYDQFSEKVRGKLEFLLNRVENGNLGSKQLFRTAIIATMSAGKSTFINSLVGYNLLPAMNQACTAKITSIHNNDALDRFIGFAKSNRGTTSFSGVVTSMILKDWNHSADEDDVYIEGNLASLGNRTYKLVLYDTPGVNYSQDRSHGDITYRFIEEHDLDLIIYVINATQISTNDDKILLAKLLGNMENKSKKPHILFLLNQADEFDLDGDDSLKETIDRIAKDLQNAGVKNPLIQPVSAYAAKLFRMALSNQQMSKKESSDFRNLYRLFTDEGVTFSTVTDECRDHTSINNMRNDRTLIIANREYDSEKILQAIQRTGIPSVETLINTLLQGKEPTTYISAKGEEK